MEDIIVLKCGGSTIDDLSDRFFRNIQSLLAMGIKTVLVHGGGAAIKEMLAKLNVESVFVDGLRRTTAEVMDVVEMVLSGSVNNVLTRKLNETGVQAIGLSGSDNRLLIAKAKDMSRLGFVGEIEEVNVSFLKQLLALGIVPVIAPIAVGRDGTRYNINADTAAGAIAAALSAKRLIFVTDVPGILQDQRLLDTVTVAEVNQLIEKGVIYGGMIPKVKAAVSSLNEGLTEVMIVDGKQSIIAENGKLIGTTIQKSAEVV